MSKASSHFSFESNTLNIFSQHIVRSLTNQPPSCHAPSSWRTSSLLPLLLTKTDEQLQPSPPPPPVPPCRIDLLFCSPFHSPDFSGSSLQLKSSSEASSSSCSPLFLLYNSLALASDIFLTHFFSLSILSQAHEQHSWRGKIFFQLQLLIGNLWYKISWWKPLFDFSSSLFPQSQMDEWRTLLLIYIQTIIKTP